MKIFHVVVVVVDVDDDDDSNNQPRFFSKAFPSRAITRCSYRPDY